METTSNLERRKSAKNVGLVDVVPIARLDSFRVLYLLARLQDLRVLFQNVAYNLLQEQRQPVRHRTQGKEDYPTLGLLGA